MGAVQSPPRPDTPMPGGPGAQNSPVETLLVGLGAQKVPGGWFIPDDSAGGQPPPGGGFKSMTPLGKGAGPMAPKAIGV